MQWHCRAMAGPCHGRAITSGLPMAKPSPNNEDHGTASNATPQLNYVWPHVPRLDVVAASTFTAMLQPIVFAEATNN